ncbi:TRAM domain-containing protein [Deferribacter autotrophicus]|uniref:TRAM domain-containing protein n=1 Tax=Deferribacter autotrophicus TaxID=500465 RepID=A0A5A8F526_9BACT|nr:TRAM domain-containing protein [Deferribacter autotrophicus]KAA0259181.1 TRAM domain-containing protein [Deferribacter autotrophicus]
MWLFRFIYSAIIIVVFVFLRDKIGIDIYYAVAYALGVILAINLIETLISDLKSYKTVSALIGGIIFLILGYLIMYPLDTFITNEPVKLGFYFVVTYIGILLGYKNYTIVENLFSKISLKPVKTKILKIPKVLDTSTLIDGRIVDVIDTGFVEGVLIIPVFVLKELQNIADSHEHLRRQKGKRGLNVLQRLKEQKKIPLIIDETDFTDVGTVDEKLVMLAKKIKGKIITTDYNLLKVAEIQNVEVLNINSLAIALRQTVLPGEELEITLVKEGKEHNQGVGYLEDGTMVVVENGKKYIGEKVKVEVTSLLQTETGRIIFTKLR